MAEWLIFGAFVLLLYLVAGGWCVAWRAMNGPKIGDAEQVMIVLLWPVWAFAHRVYRVWWRKR